MFPRALAALVLLTLVACGGGGGSDSSSSSSSTSTTSGTTGTGSTTTTTTSTTTGTTSSSTCPSSSSVGTATSTRPAGWTDATHSKNATTNYDVVFPANGVIRFDIEVSEACWSAMFSDLATKIGSSFPSTRSSVGGTTGGGGAAPGGGAGGGAGGPGGGDGEFLSGTPLWIPVTLRFNGNVWTNVGMRIKGNSTLQQTWSAGIRKLPFRFKFDEFEGAFPAIDDQRLYGLQKLSLTNNVRDKSFLREKVVADLYREFGATRAVRAARTGWVQLYVTVGSQAQQYFGLYTLVEIPDEPFLTAQFGSNDGNLYKPQGSGANWGPRSAVATATWRATFEKETNETAANWGDVEAAVDALNAANRTTDPAAWRSALEQRLNVDGFLRWLSVTGVVANWDTLGFIAHNYYLYGSPLDVPAGRLNWIPWDHDLTLERSSHDVTYPAASYSASSWPLLRYLLDDAVYGPRYRQYVLEFLASPQFTSSSLGARLTAAQSLIQPYVTGTQAEQFGTTYSALDSAAQFDDANTALRSFVTQRRATVCSQLGVSTGVCAP